MFTTEQLKERAKYFREKAVTGETPLHQSIARQYAEAFEELAEARELLANREAQPVAEVLSSRSGNDTSTIDKALPAGTKVYTAPPAPAVNLTPDFETWFNSPESGFRVVNFHIQHELQLKAWSACRAAMLAQPVSQECKLPDNVREALTLALQAMEFMGDTLNNIDAVCTEDVEYVTPAFTAVRGLLAAPEGGNDA